ncbi:MAG: S8 family serine peptidase [Candidatus Pacearchaeota archaeon]
MVYKRYILKDKKKSGPYYYKSIRKKDGNVKSVYLSNRKYFEDDNNSENIISIPFIKGFTSAIVIGVLIIFIFAVGETVNSLLSGFFIQEQTYEQNVSIATERTEEYFITLQKMPENANLKSLKISGRLSSITKAKVYIEIKEEKILVFDSSELKTITGFVPKDDEEIEKDKSEEDNKNISFQPETNLIDKSNEISLEEKQTEYRAEKNIEIRTFNNVCVKSCYIDKLTENKIKIIIETDGLIEINKVSYSFVLEPTEVEIDEEVYKELREKDTARVIIELKEKGRQNIQEIKTRQDLVISSLELSKRQKISIEDEFKLNHKYKKVNAFSGELTEKGLKKLRNNKNVKAIRIDKIVQITLDSSVPLINAIEVWKKQINGINITGRGETVCVIDTGINNSHPALAGKVIAEYCYCSVSGSPGCCPNGNIIDFSAEDDNSHGTHVAGIIASNDNTYKGIAPEVNLIVIKVCNSAGFCAESDIIAGIEYCTANASLYNISVISISIGGGAYSNYCDSVSQAMTEAINNAVGQGIIVSIASGNSGYNNKISWPACIKNATAVAATDKQDVMASYSNRNSLVDLVAPGSSIISTCLTGVCSKSGTSMATPHVAGAAVLLKQYYKLYNGKSPSASEVEQILKITGKIIHDSGSNLNYSRIDLLNAINSIYKINESEKSIESNWAKIIFFETTDLSGASAFIMKNNFIGLDTEKYPQFNKSANITFYNLSFEKMPIVLRDGNLCKDCYSISYNEGNFSFYVPHFTNYTAGSNAELNITAIAGKVNEISYFYANYTNRTSGELIEGECKINITGIEENMLISNNIFVYNKTFTMEGNYSYLVKCNHTYFESLNLSDTIKITKNIPILNLTLNGRNSNITVLNNSAVNISAYLISPHSGNLTLWLNNSIINYGESPISNFTYFYEYGSFNVTAVFNETQEYSYASKELWINVINDTIPPQWSNLHASTLNYSTNQSYYFNITWQDNVNVNYVWIEHNFAGIMQNYTANFSADNEYYYKWRDLKAGSYYYRWYANDSSGNKNSTGLLNYFVGKGQSQLKLEINNEEGNVYSTKRNNEYTATLIVPTTGKITLKRDETIIKTNDSPLHIYENLSSGTYRINASYAGNENYTAKSVVSTLTVNINSLPEEESPGTETPINIIIQCTPNWNCTNWSSCVNGTQTRNCIDLNNCGADLNKPDLIKSCTIEENTTCCATGNNYLSVSLAGKRPAIISKFLNDVTKILTNVDNFILNTLATVKARPLLIVLFISCIGIIAVLIKFYPFVIKYLKSIKIIIEFPKKEIGKV